MGRKSGRLGEKLTFGEVARTIRSSIVHLNLGRSFFEHAQQMVQVKEQERLVPRALTRAPEMV